MKSALDRTEGFEEKARGSDSGVCVLESVREKEREGGAGSGLQKIVRGSDSTMQ